MQEWQRALRAEGRLGPAYTADSELSSSNIDRHQLILPNDDDVAAGGGVAPQPNDGRGVAYTYRMEDLLTPALDEIATEGHYFPFGQNGASKCQPGFASIMTGLYRADAERIGANGLISPILPEWLPGFAWNGHQIRAIESEDVVEGDYYLTMAAGKIDWGLTHVFADSSATARQPFDRTLNTSSEGAEGRKMVDWDPPVRSRNNRPLAEIKNFIECARCDKRCTEGPIDPYTGLRPDCDDSPSGISCEARGFGHCETTPAGCTWPLDDFLADSPRIEPWRNQCLDLPGHADDKPFLVVFSPYIPHLSFDQEGVCTDHDREDECSTIPQYTQHSAYCKNRCVRNDGTSIGKPCDDSSECLAGVESCEMSGLSCDDWAWHVERNALILKAADPHGLNDRDVYTGILADDKRPACDAALVGDDCLPAASSWHGNRFGPRGELLRFINGFDRTVDELRVYLKSEGLWENTVILYTTDNGFQITSSKAQFNENGYRAPMILHDPDRPPADGSDPLCAGLPGCRADPADFGGILATICDFVDPQNGACKSICDPSQPTSEACEPAVCDGQPCLVRTFPDPDFAPSKIAESLRHDPSGNSQIGRPCVFPEDNDDVAFATDPLLRDRFVSCHYGEGLPPGGNGQGTRPGEEAYILAEILDSSNRVHRCKYYDDAVSARLYDLSCDPNERVNLTKPGAQGHYVTGYCGSLDTSGMEFCRSFAGDPGDPDPTAAQQRSVRLLKSLLYYTLALDDHDWEAARSQISLPYCIDSSGAAVGCPSIFVASHGGATSWSQTSDTLNMGTVVYDGANAIVIGLTQCAGEWMNLTTGEKGSMAVGFYSCGAKNASGEFGIALAPGPNEIWISHVDQYQNTAYVELVVTNDPP